MAFHRRGRANGFDQGIEMAPRRILASPDFVFRFEKARANLKPGAFGLLRAWSALLTFLYGRLAPGTTNKEKCASNRPRKLSCSETSTQATS